MILKSFFLSLLGLYMGIEFFLQNRFIHKKGLYQLYSTWIEVSGIGGDQWRFGALHLSGGIQF